MAQASYPDDLLYHPEHDWARIDPSDPALATLGITWYAQDSLGEVVFSELPPLGTTLTAGEPYAEVESVKAVSDVVAPLSGEVVEINESLAESPHTINEDPYGEGWLVRLRLAEESGRDRLMDAATYVSSLAG
jgi:glycine cleavage system H protein